MKKQLDGILVVEGKEDASLINSYIDGEIVVLNGFEINKTTIAYLKEAKKNKNIIVLVDPDEAGISIRKKINELLPGCRNVVVNKIYCTKGKKHGVAECEIKEIMRVLQPFLIEKPAETNNIAYKDIYLAGIDNAKKRNYITNKFNLGNCNNKQLVKRINSLGISLEEIKTAVKEYDHQ